MVIWVEIRLLICDSYHVSSTTYTINDIRQEETLHRGSLHDMFCVTLLRGAPISNHSAAICNLLQSTTTLHHAPAENDTLGLSAAMNERNDGRSMDCITSSGKTISKKAKHY